MSTKSISSTEAQNNFGRLLDDVSSNQARYIVERRGVPQAVILGLEDFAVLLADGPQRREMTRVLREMRPRYALGRIIQLPGER
jgi:prevent-host-death family protein